MSPCSLTRRRALLGVAAVTALLTATLANPAGGAPSGTPPTPPPTPPHTPQARPWLVAAQTPSQRAHELLAQMTLPEKVDLMTGNQGEAPFAYYNAPIVRLGIPALKMADASSGIGPRGWTLPVTGENATALPSMQALAATWSDATVRQYANVVTKEVLETGQNVLLAPDVDIQRQPWWGRTDEAPSEDPILNARVGGAYTNVVQSQHVIADLKHYAVYNQETARSSGQNSILDQRTLREVYTLAFESIIKQANPGSIMCSFDRINGEYSCDNPYTLRTVLKGRLGFTGFVITDFGALHDTVTGLQAGTDMETGTATFYDGALLAAVQNGTALESQVDQACLRILTTMFRLGVFDRAYTPSAIPVAAHDRVARTTEERAITLLRNAGNLLPLTRSVRSVALIGADANILAAPSGAPWVSPTVQTTMLQGIEGRAAAARTAFSWTRGNDPVNAAVMFERRNMTTVPSSVLTPSGGVGNGLDAFYWHNPDFTGAPAVSRVDQQVVYDVGFLTTFGQWAGKTSQVPTPPVDGPAEQQSVVWDGTITAPKTGAYRLGLTGYGDATLSLDGQQIVTMTGADAVKAEGTSPVLQLTAGQPHALHITYRADHPFNSLEPGSLLLQWQTPAATYSPSIQAAAQAAARANVAIVYVRTYEGEQRDRVALHLPQSSNELIDAVRAANPRTVVVLANSGPVTMPWLRRVPAVVETYYGGQEQGAALARVLWGDVNPAGHLPTTYPRSDAAVPRGVTNPWALADQRDVTDLPTPYGEGIDVGYKAYDAQGIRPLFPFGYGLTYTAFRVSGAGVSGGTAATAVRSVRFRVTNTGRRAGAFVAQVYLRLPAATGEPPRRLVTYARVLLAAGASRVVTLRLDPRSPSRPLGFFDPAADRWRIAAGRYQVFVGGNERSAAPAGSFTVAAGT